MRLKNQHTTLPLEVGCDEVGRGCLSGPVVAAAVILGKKLTKLPLRDSKKISEPKRNLFAEIIKKDAICWGIGIVSPEEIDKINILNASFLAMHRAIDKMNISPDYILVDGNRFTPYKDIPYACMIKGDDRYKNIAAASILAKTHRDQLMKTLSLDYPQYDWAKNKGYPTKAHRVAIGQFGLTPHHRMSFNLMGTLEI